MFNKILEIFGLPIMIMNSFGGIIGGIWLAFLGEWKLIGFGLILLFTAHFLLGILMIPAMPIGVIAFRLLEKKNKIGYLLGYISTLYPNILIIGTCALAFLICTSFYQGNIGLGCVPYLLWSWGMALGPWQFLASKETDNDQTMITVASASIFYFLFLFSIFISPLLTLLIIGVFIVVQLVVLPILGLYISYQMQKFAEESGYL